MSTSMAWRNLFRHNGLPFIMNARLGWFTCLPPLGNWIVFTILVFTGVALKSAGYQVSGTVVHWASLAGIIGIASLLTLGEALRANSGPDGHTAQAPDRDKVESCPHCVGSGFTDTFMSKPCACPVCAGSGLCNGPLVATYYRHFLASICAALLTGYALLANADAFNLMHHKDLVASLF